MESELATLRKNLNKSQENFRMKKKAYSKVNESFVCKVEQDLILSKPDVYVQNGCKNWSLIHKHSVILEQKCKGKLPKRNDIPELLKSATGDCNKIFDSSDSSDEENFHRIETEKSTSANPAKETLQNHGIIFPENKSANFNSKTASSQLYRCAPLNPQEEQEQLNIVLNKSILEQCGGCKVPVDNMPMSSMMPFNYQYLPSPNFAFYPTNFQFIRAPFNPQTTNVIQLQTESENTCQNMQVKCQLQLQSESENNCHIVYKNCYSSDQSLKTPLPLSLLINQQNLRLLEVKSQVLAKLLLPGKRKLILLRHLLLTWEYTSNISTKKLQYFLYSIDILKFCLIFKPVVY